MAVKPSTTYTFATNTNFAVGAFIGSATKVIPGDIPNGFVPNTGMVAEHNNYMFFWTGEWITDWLDQGTSAANADAHIVETDVSGFANAVRFAGFGPAGGHGIQGNGGTGGVGGVFTGDGNAGLDATGGSNFPGVRGQGTNAGAGVAGTGGATGDGVLGTGGGTGGDGVVGVGTAASGHGGRFTGGSSAAGVLGLPTDTGQAGVRGQTVAGALVTTAGVLGEGLGDGAGVHGHGTVTGYGVIAEADTTTPERSAFRMVPQDADPSNGAEGDVAYNSTTDELRGFANSRWQTAWTTEDGFTRGLVGPSSAANNDSATYTTLATAQLPAPYEPKHTGNVMIHAAAEFGATDASVHTTIDVRLQDTTAGATIWSQTIDHPAAVAGPIFDRPWSIVIPYALPATGVRNVELQFKKPGGAGTGVSARDAGVFILGVF